MTIKNYMDALAAAGYNPDQLTDVVHIWSNEACKGYCIDAMQQAGLNADQIRAAVKAMSNSFDNITINKAAQLYFEWM